MKKIFALTAAAVAAGTAAVAGNYVTTVPDVVVIDEPTMGGSGAWLIPLVIIAVLALALTSSESES